MAAVEDVLSALDTRDVCGAGYPADATTPEQRRRWNQARLIALALYRLHEPAMLAGEYAQGTLMMAQSVYRQRDYATGTDEELAEDIADALAEGWL
jgi:hypothetical protein